MEAYTLGVVTLGCKVNQCESDSIMQTMARHGFSVSSADLPCDVYVINTCTVTAESDRKSGQFIRRCKAKNKDAVIIVTGCFAQVNSEKVLSIPGVDAVVGNNAKSKIPALALELLKEKKQVCLLPDLYDGTFDSMRVGAPLTRTRAFIKIEDGCESKCAYCIIPFARGSIRSEKPEVIIDEVKNIVSEGCPEIVLTGIETASYGKDFKNGYSLGDLMVDLAEIDGLERIRLSSLDPSAMGKEFTDKIKNISKVMNHFHVSMQSGCTKVLNAMRRKYSVDMAKANLHYMKEQIPEVNFSADIITGFPGETEEDFEETLRFFEEEKFLHVHIFPYSKRQGTVASTMENQVPETVKKERLHRLENLQKGIKAKLLSDYLSSHATVKVLFESPDGDTFVGHTSNFMEVKVQSEENITGKILDVSLTSCDDNFLYGTI